MNNMENLFHDILRVKHEAPSALLPANLARKAASASVQKSRLTTAQKKPSAMFDKPDTTIMEFSKSSNENSANNATDVAHPFESDALYLAFVNSIKSATSAITDVDFNADSKDNKDKADKKKATIDIPIETKGIASLLNLVVNNL